MKRVRVSVSLLVVWLIFFYSIERVSEPINISRVAYPIAPLMAVLVILIPRLRKAALWALLIVPIPIFLAIKAWAGYRVFGTAIPLTITEICIITTTTILAHWVSNGVNEFESAVKHITIGPADLLAPFSDGQARMYQEVRRARHHRRPLSLLAVGFDNDSIQIALHRMVQEAQEAMVEQYVATSVARTLCDELEDYNLVARNSNRFLVLLPEVTPDRVSDVTSRLRKTVEEQLGITLRMGAASFPEETVTFEGLVEKATERMNKESGKASAKQSRQMRLEGHTMNTALPRDAS
jgi:GGDEF domain-containing protein